MEFTVTEKGYADFAEIVRAEAHGGRVLLLTEEGKAGDDVAAAFAGAGLPLTRRNVTEGVITDYATLSRSDLPEGIMAAVGAGGAAAIAAAKGIRLARNLPRLLIPLDLSALSAVDDRAFFGTKGDLLSLRCEDARVLYDPALVAKGGRVREGLGQLVALWIELFDAAYEALLEGEVCPSGALDALVKAGTRLYSIREATAAQDVAAVLLAWVREGAFRALPLTGTAHVLALLAAKTSGGKPTDFLYPAAYTLAKLYARYLGDLPLEHAAPPDRARNAELLEKRCGVGASPLLARAKGYADDYERRARLTAEYREDFAEVLFERALPLAALSRVYRRTRKGEDESPLPSPTALLTLLSLTGEAVSGYPLLRHIKTTGLLEPLLVAS